MNSEDTFNIVIEKQRLIDMLKKLSLGISSSVSIKIKDNELFSRKSISSNLYRITRFKSSYFRDITGKGSFILDAEYFQEEIISFFKNIKGVNGTKYKIMYISNQDDNLKISSENTKLGFPISTNFEEEPAVPLSFENGMPILNNELKLENHFKVDLASIKQAMKLLKKNRFMSFVIKDGILRILLWYEKDTSRYIRTPYVYQNVSSEDLIITFDRSIKKIFQSFNSKTIDVYASKTGGPVWFAEETDDFAFGIVTGSINAEPNIEHLTF